VYQFHDAELIIVGCLLRARGKKVIYDVHEDVPQDILIKNWIPRPLRRWISLAAHWTEMFGVACFNGVVAATPKIASRFPSKKTVLVQNFPRIKELECNELTPYQERPNAAVYVGSITPVRGIREMIEANALVASSLDSRMDVAGIFDDLALLDELNRAVSRSIVTSRSEKTVGNRQSWTGVLSPRAQPYGIAAEQTVRVYVCRDTCHCFGFSSVAQAHRGSRLWTAG
jgi:glycosyltransferase involved in cell wall biosynthesis